jgi:hypothetical protein
MNPTLHPKLAELYDAYTRLHEQYAAGRISFDDAMAALASLSAVDGDGVLWGMSPQGEFVAAYPGDAPSAADPSRFAPARIPHDPGVPLLQAPIGMGQAPKLPSSRSLRDAGQPTGRDKTRRAVSGGASKVAGKLGIDRRLLVIAGVVLAIVVAVVVTRGETTTVPDGGLPSGLPTAAPSAPGEPATAAPVLPTGEQSAQLLANLASGDRALAASAVANAGEGDTAGLQAARFAGYKVTGYVVVAGPAAADGDNAVLTLTLVDTTDNRQIASTNVTLVRGGDSWQFVSWPSFK